MGKVRHKDITVVSTAASLLSFPFQDGHPWITEWVAVKQGLVKHSRTKAITIYNSI